MIQASSRSSSLSSSQNLSEHSGVESDDRERSGEETFVLIVDDHPAIREALTASIEQEPDLRVVGAFSTIAEVWAFLEDHAPDVLVLDLSLGDGDGLALIEDLQAQVPEVKVLVYSMHAERVYAGQVLRAGALGFVPKSVSTDTVVTAIRRVEQGEIYLREEVTSHVLGNVIRNRKYGSNPLEQLTDRELTVFRRIGEGESIREIADRLDLSRKTVETYRRRAKEKLGYETVDELLRFAVQWKERKKDEQS